MTLASYSILLIPYCHKKNIINFGTLCCPPPMLPLLPGKTKPKTPVRPFHNRFSTTFWRLPYESRFIGISSNSMYSAYSLTLTVTVIVSSSMSTCHVSLCHVILSMLYHYINYKLNVLPIG